MTFTLGLKEYGRNNQVSYNGLVARQHSTVQFLIVHRNPGYEKCLFVFIFYSFIILLLLFFCDYYHKQPGYEQLAGRFGQIRSV